MPPVATNQPQSHNRLTWGQVKAINERLLDQGQQLDFIWDIGFDCIFYEHIYSHDTDGQEPTRSFTMISPRWLGQHREQNPGERTVPLYRTFNEGHAFRCQLKGQTETHSPIEIIEQMLQPRDLIDIITVYRVESSQVVYDWPVARLEQEVWQIMQDEGRLQSVLRRNAHSMAMNGQMTIRYPANIHARQMRRPAPWQIIGQWQQSDPPTRSSRNEPSVQERQEPEMQ